MATHAELTELFGPDGVVRAGRADALANGVSEADADLLAETGVPSFVDVLFTVDVKSEPKAFTLVPVDAGDEQVSVLSLGGPTDDESMRYCLDLDKGYVILLTLGPEPSAEIVNRTLGDFVEFLYRFALGRKHTAAASDAQAAEYTAKLRSYLTARDEYAFADPEGWWSMVYDQLA